MLTKEERAAWIAKREAEHQKIKDRHPCSRDQVPAGLG